MEKLDIDWALSHDEEFRYQLLGRMQWDCDYYLGYGKRCPKHLWAGNEKEQIEAMKSLWNSFPEDGKPEWLTWEQIEKYEADMVRDHKYKDINGDSNPNVAMSYPSNCSGANADGTQNANNDDGFDAPEGECPICANNELTYGNDYLEDGSFVYEWQCTKCGASGKELHRLTFITHILD